MADQKNQKQTSGRIAAIITAHLIIAIIIVLTIIAVIAGLTTITSPIQTDNGARSTTGPVPIFTPQPRWHDRQIAKKYLPTARIGLPSYFQITPIYPALLPILDV